MRFIAPPAKTIFALGVNYPLKVAAFDPALPGCISPARDSTKAADLAGYRNHSVFIQRSDHVPPNHEAVPACMEALFRLLREETDPWIRAVLGHFVFVFVHPYPDGNGRIARFLMNLMLASGGYPWTVIRLQSRDTYLSSLEQASVDGNITPFAQFVAAEMAVSPRQA